MVGGYFNKQTPAIRDLCLPQLIGEGWFFREKKHFWKTWEVSVSMVWDFACTMLAAGGGAGGGGDEGDG